MYRRQSGVMAQETFLRRYLAERSNKLAVFMLSKISWTMVLKYGLLPHPAPSITVNRCNRSTGTIPLTNMIHCQPIYYNPVPIPDVIPHLNFYDRFHLGANTKSDYFYQPSTLIC